MWTRVVVAPSILKCIHSCMSQRLPAHLDSKLELHTHRTRVTMDACMRSAPAKTFEQAAMPTARFIERLPMAFLPKHPVPTDRWLQPGRALHALQ